MKITLEIRVTGLHAAIEDALSSATSLDGLGNNGDSAYEVVSADATSDDAEPVFTVEVEVERIEGLFASKDEVTDALIEEIGGIVDNVEIEVEDVSPVIKKGK